MFKSSLRWLAVRTAMSFALWAVAVAGTHAGVVTIAVSDLANIQGAGHSVAPNPGGGSGGILPPSFAFAANSGFVLQTTSVIGTTSLTPGYDGINGEGSSGFATNISSYGGISGIVNTNRSGFLVGVFLDDSEPVAGTEPARLSFASPENFTSLSPLLRQTFLIGDGRTDSGGVVQSFVAPAGATRLFFGFADAPSYTGFAGAFQDNSGRSLSVTFNDAAVVVASPAAVPAPAVKPVGLLLLGVGVLCVAGVYRQRRLVQRVK